MAAQPTSPRLTSELAPTVQRTPPAAATEATVHAVATVQLETTLNVTAAPLVGATTENYDVQARFNRANDYLNAKDKENARRIFEEIIDYLKVDLNAVESLLMTACCQIGAALTYPNGTAEKSYLATQGKEKCDQIFANRASWHEDSKKSNYMMLIKSYDGLLFALPPKDPARKDIQTQLVACRQELKSLNAPSAPPVSASPVPAAATEHVRASLDSTAPSPISLEPPAPPKPASPPTSPRKAHASSEPAGAPAPLKEETPPFDVQASYKSAKESLSNGKHTEARTQFDKIIQHQSESEDNSIEHLLILAGSAIGNACTFQQADNAEDVRSRASFINMAVRACDEIYNRRWNPSDTRKNIEYYERLKEHYSFLVNNVSDDEKDELVKRLSVCVKSLKSLKESLAAKPAPAAASADASKEKKVTFEIPFNATASYEAAQRTLLISKNYDQARSEFLEIIKQLSKAEPTPDILLVLAGSEIGVASTFERTDHTDEDPQRKIYIDLAVKRCATIYASRESWSTLNSVTHIAYYEMLISHYLRLGPIVPREKREEITQSLTICNQKVTSLKTSSAPSKEAEPKADRSSSPLRQPSVDPQPKSPPVPPIKTAATLNPANPIPPSGQPAPTPTSPSTSPRKAAAPGPDSPRKVTPGPVGSSSKIRFIFGLSIAAILATIAGVVIYRRWVVKK